MPVAFLGLLVNVASALLLHAHAHDDDHGHHHGQHHDHNHRAALMHVVADSMTSALAIVALLAGLYLGLAWLDPVTGVAGGLVILHWALALCRTTAAELLDVSPSATLESEVRERLEALGGVRVCDLRVWSVGGAAKSCVMTLASERPQDPDTYRRQLAEFGFVHLTIEVRTQQRQPKLEPVAACES